MMLLMLQKCNFGEESFVTLFLPACSNCKIKILICLLYTEFVFHIFIFCCMHSSALDICVSNRLSPNLSRKSNSNILGYHSSKI